jgi:hypothetical protein
VHCYVCYRCVLVAIWNQFRVIKKKLLILDTYHPYTVNWHQQGFEDLWLFLEAKAAPRSNKFGKHWFRDYRTHFMRHSHVAKASIYIGQNNVKTRRNVQASCEIRINNPFGNQNMTQPQDSILMGYDTVSIGIKSLTLGVACCFHLLRIAESSSETSVTIYQSVLRHIPEDLHLHQNQWVQLTDTHSCIGHIFLTNCFVHYGIKGKIERREDEEEYVSSYWITLWKRENTGNWRNWRRKH